MLGIYRSLALLLVFAQAGLTQPLVRLQGLDRLYFEHVGGGEDRTAAPAFLAELLPAEIKAADLSPQKAVHKVKDGGLECDAEVRDFPLPAPGAASDLSIRQVSVGTESQRITRLWWALYDHGQRSDVWYFTADPGRTEHKILSNYEIEAALASAGGVELQVYGSMFRPQGAWSVTGKTLNFSMHDKTLLLSQVRNDFGFFRSYDVRSAPRALDIRTEHEVSGGFAILHYDKIPDGTLRACGFQDPYAGDNWEFNWKRLQRVTNCIAVKAHARTSYRKLDQPSFIERGGSE